LILKIRKTGTTKILAEENYSIVVEASEKSGKTGEESIKIDENLEEEKKEINEKNKHEIEPTRRDNEEKGKGNDSEERKRNKKRIVKTSNVIKLGQSKPSKKENVVYEAGSEKIKRHAIHWFVAFLLFVLVMMAKRKI